MNLRVQSAAASAIIRYADTPNRTINLGGIAFAYRDLGQSADGVPLVLLNHWGAVLDNFDPRIVDGLVDRHRIIAIDHRGIGGSGGRAPLSIDEMAHDVIAVVRALGFERIDLLGFSLGGFVAQDVVIKAPHLVRKLVLTGTGPAGGQGIERVGRVSFPLIIKSLFTRQDPKTYLFFTSSAAGRRAAAAFLHRIKERTQARDPEPTLTAFWRQLKAIEAWGRQAPQDLSRIAIPTLVANGDRDVMVPTDNSRDLAQRIRGAQLVIYPDAGHGGIFQYHADFVITVKAFLAA